jgi:dihydrofolate reductase
MKAIVAVNNLGFIGKGDVLLWYNSDDLKHFKKLTEGGRLLVGYRTFGSLPTLSNRELILDMRNYCRKDWDWCIGGKKLMKNMHLTSQNYIYHILMTIKLGT